MLIWAWNSKKTWSRWQGHACLIDFSSFEALFAWSQGEVIGIRESSFLLKKGFQLEWKRVAFPYEILIWDSFIVVCCLCSVNFRFSGARHRKLQSTQSYLLPRIVKDRRCPPDLLCEMASKKVMQDRCCSFFHNWSKMSLLRLSGIRHGHEGAIPFWLLKGSWSYQLDKSTFLSLIKKQKGL